MLNFGVNFWCYLKIKSPNNWVKKYMEYQVEGARPTGRPKKAWTEIVEKDCQARRLNTEDVMDCIRWMKQVSND